MKIDGGKLMVEILKEQNVKFVFGIPGGQTLYINNAIYDSDIQFIHTRHENAAACAADAWGRATGTPGICLATTGPGATNFITGIGGALRDSSPMIAIVCQNKTPDVGRGDAQEVDHASIFESICKKFISIPNISKLPWAMREAFRIAKTGRPGPVVVEVYRDVLENQQAEYTYASPEEYCVLPKCRPFAEDIEKAVSLIKENGKVAILSGNGVKYSNAGEQVIKLADTIDAPVVTTFNGISGVSNDEDKVFGPRSRHGSKLTRSILEEADTVLILGSSLSAITTNRWSISLKKIIQVDIEPEIIGRQYPVKCGLVGDVGQVVSELIKKLSNDTPHSERIEWLKDLKLKEKDWKETHLQADIEATPIPPIAVMNELSKYIVEDALFCVDAGNPGAWSHVIQYKKGVKHLKPVNYGNMGFALPAGIACQLAYPEQEVYVMLGDGSLGMTMADIETAARCNLPIFIFLMNDTAFGNIRQEEKYLFGDRYNGVEFSDVDYVELAKAMGCEAQRINKASELKDAILAARESKSQKPRLFDIRINGDISVWPEAF